MSCPYIHSDIRILYGVPVMPIEELPKICVCGSALTYSKDLVFAEFSDLSYGLDENQDVIKIEKVIK